MTRRTWPLALLLAAPIVVVASLPMPWVTASCGGTGSGYLPAGADSGAGLLNLGSCYFVRVDGWAPVGYPAVLASILVVALVALRRLPAAGQAATAVAYFALGVAANALVQGRNDLRVLRQSGGVAGGVHLHVAHGAYVGLAGAALALVGAARVARPRSPAALPAAALLVALLLPWLRGGTPSVSEIGLATPAGTIAAALALWLLVARGRLAVAAACALFVGAALDVPAVARHAYGAWMGLAFAVVLVAACLGDLTSLRAVRPTATRAAAAVFVASLFLPWQHICAGPADCFATDGFGLAGSSGALAALALAVPLAQLVSRHELAAALALLVATLGFQLERGTQAGVQYGFGYGAYVGFVAAAALVVATLAPLSRPATLDLVPIGIATAYAVAVVLPWWGVLPDGVWGVFLVGPARLSWLTLASALLAVRLVGLWWREQRGGLVVVSLCLVALSVLESLPLPTVRLTWNTAVLVGLAAPLAVHAVVEARGGWRSLPVPEVLRIDRIS